MITNFNIFVNEGYIGAGTTWTDDYNNKKITMSLQSINKYLDDNNVPVELIDTNLIEPILINTQRDPVRIERANLDFPIIVTKSNGKFIKVLDGQHRVVKCINNHINKIKARVLDLDTLPDVYKSVLR